MHEKYNLGEPKNVKMVSFTGNLIDGLSKHYRNIFTERDIENIACKMFQEKSKGKNIIQYIWHRTMYFYTNE